METIDLVFYAGMLVYAVKMCLDSLVAARRYEGWFVRPGLHLLFIFWLALASAWFAGFRFEVATGVPNWALYLPTAAAVAASFYFSAEEAYNRKWGPPEPDQPAFGGGKRP